MKHSNILLHNLALVKGEQEDFGRKFARDLRRIEEIEATSENLRCTFAGFVLQ